MSITGYISGTALMSLILFASCDGHTEKRVTASALSVDDTLCYEVVESQTVPLGLNLWDWKIVPSHIVFFHQGQEQYCTLYETADPHEAYPIANKGHGSDEYISCCWCKTKANDEFALYDIMKGRLNIYGIERQIAKIKTSYPLPADGDGMTKPYTGMVHSKDHQYLMKEDGDETNLRLVDLDNGREIASYHCAYRDNRTGPYTPYDFLFQVIGDKVILSYCYFDRTELLQIKDDAIELLAAYGEECDFDIPTDYDLLEYSSLYIDTKDGDFYILKSREGQDEGEDILVLNAKTHKATMLRLSTPVKLFGFDTQGALVGYNESGSGSEIYTFREKTTD
ncbi:MAG: hypothetical protein NC113_09645 [Bacteroides sp.]|nr:hypothetical protein [Bacteroides sp.]MCM1448457.1 hypothetical protein [Bacteroides sp.]